MALLRLEVMKGGGPLAAVIRTSSRHRRRTEADPNGDIDYRPRSITCGFQAYDTEHLIARVPFGQRLASVRLPSCLPSCLPTAA